MTNKILIAGNWKMNPLRLNEAEALFNSLRRQIRDKKGAEVAVCPPFVYISKLKFQNSKIKLGGQDCFWEEKGAFTGEISPKMLKNLGCTYVILGHSERRAHIGETNEIILKKLKTSLKFGLKPILCIGENKEQKKEGETFDVLMEQIKNTLAKLPNIKATNVVIAYEPVWAIGTGDNCPANEAMAVLMFIKKQLLKLFSKRIVEKILILYGGSVNSKNAKQYIDAGFDGLLVGSSSLKPGEFALIVKNCRR
jgi:triosephosphate isomerase